MAASLKNPPNILIPNFKDRQLETFAKSVQNSINVLHENSTNINTNVGALTPNGGSSSSGSGSTTENGTQYTAGSNIGIYQVVSVVYKGVVITADVIKQANAVAGIALNSGSNGASILVATDGISVSNPGWNFALPNQPVFLSTTGSITQTLDNLPVNGNVVRIGLAVNNNTILVQIDDEFVYASDNMGLVDTTDANGNKEFSYWPMLPSLNTIPAGQTVNVPIECNLISCSNVGGLNVLGTLNLVGNLVFV